MASLRVVSGEQAGTTFVLQNRSMSIGREASCDIQVKNRKTSRKHAVLGKSNAGHFLRPRKDLINPVLLNGKEIDAEVVLSTGDQITIGSDVLVYLTDDDHIDNDAAQLPKDPSRRVTRPTTI